MWLLLVVSLAFVAVATSSDSIKATIFADNYFEFYVNGHFIRSLVYSLPHSITCSLTHLLSLVMFICSGVHSLICFVV